MGRNTIIDPGIMQRPQWQDAPAVLTAAQLVPLLLISQSSVYSLLNMPGFPTLRVKGRKFVYKKSLEQWLNSYQGGDVSHE